MVIILSCPCIVDVGTTLIISVNWRKDNDDVSVVKGHDYQTIITLIIQSIMFLCDILKNIQVPGFLGFEHSNVIINKSP